MTRQQLQACSKEKLAAMARRRGIADTLSMSKDKLVHVLTRLLTARPVNGKALDPRKAARPRPQTAAARKTTQAPAPRERLRIAKSKRASSPLPLTEVTPRELRANHTKDRIVVMVRDPYWLHCYWELTRYTMQRAEAALGQDWHGSQPILRLFDVNSLDTTCVSEQAIRDVPIHGGCNNWYLDVPNPPRSYRIDIGYLTKQGKFFVLARSNVVTTPRPGNHNVVDGNWADLDAQKANRIYAMSCGFEPNNGKREIKEFFEERLGKPLDAPALASMGTGPLLGHQRRFTFDLEADLIVYGKTEPLGRVTIQGEPVKLRPDGSFSMRFRLPDSRQILPASARSADGLEERTIVLAVERNIKHLQPMLTDGHE